MALVLGGGRKIADSSGIGLRSRAMMSIGTSKLAITPSIGYGIIFLQGCPIPDVVSALFVSGR